MAYNFFNRYIWLIDTIRAHGHITFTDISDLWRDSALNDTGERLSERTFFNHKDAIKDTFGITIKFDKTMGYYLQDEDFDTDGIRSWLLASLSVNNTLTEGTDMRSRILFEREPSGEKYLSSVIRAMREGKQLEISYRKFKDDEARTFDICPFALKIFKQRWYLIGGKNSKDLEPHIYALDRVEYLQQTRRDFKMPDKFDAEDYFAGYFGIVVDKNERPQRIVLKVYSKQRQYFRTLPLHKSQKEVEIQPDYSIFEYWMAPTWDLDMDLMQYADEVEVMEPECLRDEIIDHAWCMLDAYKET